MPPADLYTGRSHVSSQGDSWALIVPGDTSVSDLEAIPKALWIDVAGTIKLTGADGNANTFTVTAGPLPLRPRRVWATGTTATGIHGLF